MTFFNFLCQKLESVDLSETVLESFPDNDNFDYFLQKKKLVKNRNQEIQSHLHLKDCG